MTRDNLFELQSALVECLTSPNAVSEFQNGEEPWKRLSFLDLELVQLLSSLYRGKRLDKLAKVFPKTLEYLEPEMPELTADFLKRHPPLNADSYTAGCQFYGFLKRRWRTCSPSPPFVPDLAYCELARVGLERQTLPPGAATLTSGSLTGPRQILIRRQRGVRLCASQHDIRPLFDPDQVEKPIIAPQPIWVVLSRPLGATSGRIYGVDEKLFGLLGGWRSWTALALGTETSHVEQTLGMLRRLEQVGFVEVQV